MASRRSFLYGSLGLGIISGCGNQDSTTQPGTQSVPVSINGAGASLPAPLYLKWFKEYNTLFPNVQVSYQPIGSVAGVRQFMTNTVDFGASDVGMTPPEIAKVDRGVVMIPMTIGSIVLAYNLPEVPNLKLSRRTYTDLFLGKITRWNDPAIAQDNPDANLPDRDLTVIRRSDASGTTGIFTQHLAAISEEWKTTVGAGTSVPWPPGTIGSRGNEGVTAQVLQQVGAIGYLESTYAKQNRLGAALMENKSGNYVAATTANVGEAISSLVLPENLLGFVNDPVSPTAYPIVTYSWLLLYRNYPDPNQIKTLKEVLTWCLTDGQKFAEELGYVPMPDRVVSQAQAVLSTIGL